MQEERQPQAIELIWDLWVQKRQQATNIIHAMHLGAKRGLFMKIALHKVTVLSGSDFTPSFGSNAAWPACDHTVYVWQVCVVNTAVPGADWPFGDVIRPLMRCDRGWLQTSPWVLVTN